MAGFRRWPVAIVIGFALISVTPADSHAAPILDQSQLIVGNGLQSCAGTATTFTICGQSFTVGLTGTLTSVDFWLLEAVGTPEAGLYTAVSGAGATLAQTSATALAFSAAGFYSFAFSYPVSAGDVLFFGLRQDPGDAFDAPLASPSPYASGGRFAFVSPNFFGDIPEDGTFRTFVDTETAVPEPATLTLLGLGLAGMGARRWRQRKA